MSVRLIPKFIKAPTERELMLKMLQYQLKNQKQCNAISIYPNKEHTEFTLWFYDEISNQEISNAAKSVEK